MQSYFNFCSDLTGCRKCCFFFFLKRERRIPSSNMPYFHYHVCGVLLQAVIQYCHCEWKKQLIKKEEERGRWLSLSTLTLPALFQALNMHSLPKEIQQLNEGGATLFSSHRLGNGIQRDEVINNSSRVIAGEWQSQHFEQLHCTVDSIGFSIVFSLICPYNL